jgi:hypothetical protein
MKDNQTSTIVLNNCINKGKNVLHLVLKKKTHEKQIVEDLGNELEQKMEKIFIEKIAPKLQKVKLDNPEKALRVAMLKALIAILKKMIEQTFGELTSDDQKLIEEIMKEDDNKNNSPKKQEDEKEKNNNPKNNQPQVSEPIPRSKTSAPPSSNNFQKKMNLKK